jgi:ring-1,2-phenylacetyl-CoA epoxidase subunit PaaD
VVIVRTVTEDTLRTVADSVPDPEMPVLTLGDLGVIREVRLQQSPGAARAKVRITPTYVACPALGTIKDDLRRALAEIGVEADVEVVLSPRWHPGLISARGRARLAAAGIAPPGPAVGSEPAPVDLGMPTTTADPDCPRCGSPVTRLISGRGPTPCTSIHVCRDCAEPFEKVRDR